MARYADFRYGTRQYGASPRAVSRSFLLAQAIDYGQVRLTLEVEQRIGFGFALTRTRAGAAEDPSNGVVVSSGVLSVPLFSVVDGVDTLTDADARNDVSVPSGMVYYTLFIFDSDGSWFKDAATSIVVPKNYGSQLFLASLLPTSFLSEDGNPFGYVPATSDLYKFLGGLAVTYDELKTSLDLVVPQKTRGRGVVRRLHDAYAASLGMPVESSIGVAASSRLYRDAGLIFQSKGTRSAVQVYAEALTNWNTTVTESTNLLLSLDDSSFEGGVGNWDVDGGTLLSAQVDEDAVTTPEAEFEDSLSPFARGYVGRVTLTSASATLALPGDGSRLKSIPVDAGETYYLKVPARAASGTPSVTLGVRWLRQSGEEISVSSGSAVSTTSSWSTIVYSAEAPPGAHFAALSLVVAGTSSDVVDLDMISFAASNTHFREPRCIDVICGPARLNLLADPSFEIESSWTSEEGTLEYSTEQALVGAQSGKCSGEDFRVVSESIPALPDFPLTLAGHSRGSGSATYVIEFLDEDDALLSSQEIEATVSDSEWYRVDETVFPDAAAATLRLVLEGSGTVYFDAISLERADRPLVYFDATVSDQSGEDSKLATKGGNAYSLLYPNRLVKLSRLRQTLPFYLPMGVRARVLLWDSPDPQVQDLLPYGN